MEYYDDIKFKDYVEFDQSLLTPIVLETAEFVKEAHKNQFRKDGITAFVTHPYRVANLVGKYLVDTDICAYGYGKFNEVLIATLLHDYVEDVQDADLDGFLNKIYKDDIKTRNRIKTLVLALTKNNSLPNRLEKDEDSFDRIKKSGYMAILIKFCDRQHNVSDMVGMSKSFKRRYINETFYMLGYFYDYFDYPFYKDLVKITNKQAELYNDGDTMSIEIT